MDEITNDESGGFITATLPSPAPSNSTRSSITSNLPHPRSHPLRAGSAKEGTARRYVEGRLLHISRRYTKKFQPADPAEEVHGYECMNEAAKDLGEVVDVLWLSGTPSLQIPYLLNVALSVTTYLPSFPPAPVATFKLLGKLDHAFASLLKGEDNLTGEILPGFERGKRAGMSGTDMVRCKSLVEATRVLVVEVMSSGAEIDRDDEESGMDTDMMSTDRESTWDADQDVYDMDVARVYEATITQLGGVLETRSGYDAGSGLS
ncbi:hypothetical protein OIDMADRAFT_154136 [Oidiodendron maius Zn]|uniref:Meiotic recombination protein DMC1 n=1 Tax=Oidiodendron maius (strain Zn) TaxID=913774 RepID=A0A0C3HBQ4_OIDMZ|nr:hypothetical protein OIDMADRAFT_154136 [Oidiodendron maius Zn]